MEHDIHWGVLVALYLFLAGAGAGTIFISAFYVLDKKIEDIRYLKLARLSSLSGVLLLVIGVGMIVLDLTTFKAGIENFDLNKLLRFYKLFMTFVPSSIMSWGTWLLFISIPLSFAFTISLYISKSFLKYRTLLARINMILSIGICTYTAFLLGDVMHNIVWSNSALVILFMVSALSSGLAIVLLFRVLLFKEIKVEEALVFNKIDASLLSFELLCVAIFAYTVAVISKAQNIDYIFNFSNKAGILWWIGAVTIGLLIPLLINIYALAIKKKLSHTYEYLLITALLIGGFCLRYAVLLAGQMY